MKLPGNFETAFAYKLDDYENAEKLLHKILSKYRIDGEWFKLNQNELELIKANCEAMGGVMITEEIDEAINEPINEVEKGYFTEEINEYLMKYRKIPEKLRLSILGKFNELPYTAKRNIKIYEELIISTIEILNISENKTLPQNARYLAKEETPFGLDRLLKEKLKTDLSTASIVSDELKDKNIVEIIKKADNKSSRKKFHTRLKRDWTW